MIQLASPVRKARSGSAHRLEADVLAADYLKGFCVSVAQGLRQRTGSVLTVGNVTGVIVTVEKSTITLRKSEIQISAPHLQAAYGAGAVDCRAR